MPTPDQKFERNFSTNSTQKTPDQSGPESLKSHDRTVSTKEERAILIAEYEAKGWEIEEQDEQHAKLRKDIDTVLSPTPRMRSTTATLEVNINVESNK
jgi:hypothetical protein